EQLRDLGVLHVADEVAVTLGVGGVPLVLAPHRHDHLVEERVAEAGDLRPRARLLASAVKHAHLAAAPARPGPRPGLCPPPWRRRLPIGTLRASVGAL